MKIRLELLYFIPISILLICGSILASDQEMRISDADEEWTTSIRQIDQDVIDSSNASTKLPVEAAVCGADEVLTFGLYAVPQAAIDSSGAAVKLPVEAAVCHADEVWNNDLVSSGIDGTTPTTNRKTPVLFVPGILGTEISDGNIPTWLDIDRLVNPLRHERKFTEARPLQILRGLDPRNTRQRKDLCFLT